MNNTVELLIKTTNEGSIQSVKLLKSSLTETKGAVDSVSASVNKMGKAFSLAGAYYSIKRLGTAITKFMGEAIDRTEELNLFNVVFKNVEKDGVKTFSTLGKEATKFQNKLNESFGTNMTETLRAQSLFQSMGENAGIEDKYAAIMSESLTKFSYDLGSLYNKSEKDVAEALRAGIYAGQTKPLRNYGIDVTEKSMGTTLSNLGITDKQVSDFSQAEKEILRYISALNQAKVAMGDYANTIESPANQMKVFKNLLIDCKVALSNLFIGTFAKILPYVNALLMVVKEVGKAIASMFGIKMSDYNNQIASVGDVSDGMSDVGSNAGNAAKKVKELKREILGFDQINNIEEPKDTGSSGGSGGGGGVSGGIDQRLLDAIKGYDNGMDKVRMKALDIRDRIMEWLGFTKRVNEETGETYFTLDNTNSTMYKIIKAIKDIIVYGKEAIKGVLEVIKKDFDNGIFGSALVAVFQMIANFLKFIAEHKSAQVVIAKLVEAFLLFKTVKTILNPVVTLYKNLMGHVTNGANAIKTFSKQLKGTNNYIKDSNGNLKEYNKTVEGHSNVILNADKSVNKWETAMSKAKTALGGLAVAGAGLVTLKIAMDDVSESGWNLSNGISAATGALTTIGGMAAAGSVFSTFGTAIGAAVGAIALLITVTSTWKSETEIAIDKVNEKTKEYRKTMKDLADSRNETLSSINTEYGYYEKLFSELQSITDENGKIKQGYEERASVITTVLSEALGIEIQIVDGVIQKYGDLKSSIEKVIEAKKAEAVFNAHEAEYQEALKQKTELEKNYAKAVSNTKKAQGEYNDALKKIAEQFGLTNKQVEDFYNGTLSINETSGELNRKLTRLSADGNITANMYKYWKEQLDNANESQRKAGKELDDNQVKIDSYNKAIELMAQKNYDAVLKMYNNTVEFNGKTKKENDKKYKNEISILDSHLKDLQKNRNKYSKEEYDKLVEGINLQKEALKKKKKEANQILEEEKTANLGTIQKFVDESNSKLSKKGTYKIDVDTRDADTNLATWIGNMSKKLIGNIQLAINNTKADGGSFYNNSWHNIPQYANGGAPSHGTMFVAGEAGAEVVGHVNGRTEVLNQSQLASVMYSAVSSAMSQQANKAIEIYAHTDEGVIIDRINQKTNQTGVCPINIPY